MICLTKIEIYEKVDGKTKKVIDTELIYTHSHGYYHMAQDLFKRVFPNAKHHVVYRMTITDVEGIPSNAYTYFIIKKSDDNIRIV